MAASQASFCLLANNGKVGSCAVFFFTYVIAALIFCPISGKLFDEYGLHKIFYPEVTTMGVCAVALFYDNTLLFDIASVLLALG